MSCLDGCLSYVFSDYFLAQRSDFPPWLHGNITVMTGQQEVAPPGQEIAQHIPPHPDVSLHFCLCSD